MTRHAYTIYIYVLLTLFSLSAFGQPLVRQTGHEALNVCILGDSNAWLSGDDCTDARGWPYWFAQRFAPKTCHSYARSGATWTHTPQTERNTAEYTEKLGPQNVVFNQVERLVADVRSGRQVTPHIIIICCGTNDAWFQRARPQALSRTADQAFADRGGLITKRAPSSLTTLADCVRYNCELLMQVFPEAQILLVAPPQTTNPGATRIRAVGDLIEACGRYLGAACIRLDIEGCIYEPRERAANTFTYDGTHTSTDGARRNGCLIANQAAARLWF